MSFNVTFQPRSYKRHAYSGKRVNPKRSRAAFKREHPGADEDTYCRTRRWRNETKTVGTAAPERINLKNNLKDTKLNTPHIKKYFNKKKVNLDLNLDLNEDENTDTNADIADPIDIKQPMVLEMSVHETTTMDESQSTIYDIQSITETQSVTEGTQSIIEGTQSITEEPQSVINEMQLPINASDEMHTLADPLDETNSPPPIVYIEDSHQQIDDSTVKQEPCNANKVNLDSLKGYRIVDIQHILKWSLKMQREHTTICASSHIDFVKEERNGLQSTFIFKCTQCSETFAENSENTKEINKALVWGVLNSGSSYSQATALLSAMNVPTLTEQQYSDLLIN